MWFRKISSRLRNTFFCNIETAKIFPWSFKDKDFYRLILVSKGIIRIYINDIKVPKKKSYVCGLYKDSNTIKIKIKGLLNSKTFFLPVNSPIQFVNLAINLPDFNKTDRLDSMEIKSKAPLRCAELLPKTIVSTKSPLTKANPFEVLKSKKRFSLNIKNHQLNNSTNRPISWKN